MTTFPSWDHNKYRLTTWKVSLILIFTAILLSQSIHCAIAEDLDVVDEHTIPSEWSGPKFKSFRKLKDEILIQKFKTAQQDGLFKGDRGEKTLEQFEQFLNDRYRNRFKAIPDPLWKHLGNARWTEVLLSSFFTRTKSINEITGQDPRKDSNTRSAENFSSMAMKLQSAESTIVSPAAYTIEDNIVYLTGDEAVIKGRKVIIPPVDYIPLPENKTLQEMTSDVLHFSNIGEPFAQGGMRFVYKFPGDPKRIIKVYVPEKIDTIRVNGNLPMTTPVLTAFFIQRDVTVARFLLQLHTEYVSLGELPPYEIALIDEEQRTTSHGIILQQKAAGLSIWKDLPDKMEIKYLEGLDNFFRIHRLLDKALYDFAYKRYDLHLKVQPSKDMEYSVIGLDHGRNYSNLFLLPDGRPILIDW